MSGRAGDGLERDGRGSAGTGPLPSRTAGRFVQGSPRPAGAGGGLEAAVRTPLRGFELGLELAAVRGRRSRWSVGRGRARPSMLRAIAGLLSPARRPGRARGLGLARHRARHRPRAGAARLRLPLPGLRALPADERLAQRRLRDARGRGASAGRRRWRCSSASGWRRLPRHARRRCRGASASGSRWPGRWRQSRRCCCSTSRSRPSTRPPGARRSASCAPSSPRPATPVVLVTHSFEEAAALAGELIVIEAGREIQRGSAAEISASPASAFVADFSGAVVLRGEATRRGRPDPRAPAGRRRGVERRPGARPGRAERLPLGDLDRGRRPMPASGPAPTPASTASPAR